jgi:lysophospholipase L1-like esterase
LQKVPLTKRLFQGAVSLEVTDTFVKPIRIPIKDAHLYVPNRINEKANIPAGVRISFFSNSHSLIFNIVACESDTEMDCLINGRFLKTGLIKAGETSITFDLPVKGNQFIELYLSQRVPVKVSSIWIDLDATWAYDTSQSELRWITYGSSITQCVEAESPSQTWPAIVSRKMNFGLTCLGYDGNCQLDPMVARMIRDLPADFISLCVGINIYGHQSLSERTFAPGLIGFIQTIRDRQPEVPILIISPIYYAKEKEEENQVGFTMRKMRKEIASTVNMLCEYDKHLYYINGLELFGKTHVDYLSDGLHPNAAGYKIMAKQFLTLMKEKIPRFSNL